MGGEGSQLQVGDANRAERAKIADSKTPAGPASLADANIADIKKLGHSTNQADGIDLHAVPIVDRHEKVKPIELASLTRKEVDPEDWKFLPKVNPDVLAPKAVDGKEENGYEYHPANPPGLDARPGAEYDAYHKKEHRKVDTTKANYVGYEGNIFQGTYGQAGATDVEFKFDAGEKADADGNVIYRVVNYTAADGSAKGPNLKLAGANDDIGKNVHQISWNQEAAPGTSKVFVERYPEAVRGTKGETETWIANADVAEDGLVGTYAWESWRKAADGTIISHTVLDKKTAQPVREDIYDVKGEKVIKIVNNWYSEDGKSRVEWVTDETDRAGKKAEEFNKLIVSLKTHVGSGATNDDLRTALDALAKAGPVDKVLVENLTKLNDSFGTTQNGAPGGKPVEVTQAVVEQALRNVLIGKQGWPAWMSSKAGNDEPGRLISKTDFVDGRPVRERKYEKTEDNKAAGKDEVILVTSNYDAAGLLQSETTYRKATQAEAEKQRKASGEQLPRKLRKNITQRGGFSLTRYDEHDKVIPPIEYYDRNNKPIGDDTVREGTKQVRKKQNSP